MKKINIFSAIVFLSLFGCAQITETAKVIWGSSTAALERARDNALTKTYFCDTDECFDAILTLAEDDLTLQENRLPTTKAFNVFSKNRSKGQIVVMGIKGNVDTTKVGIFLDRKGLRTTQIDISSLSSTAKEKVALAVFEELGIRFSEKL